MARRSFWNDGATQSRTTRTRALGCETQRGHPCFCEVRNQIAREPGRPVCRSGRDRRRSPRLAAGGHIALRRRRQERLAYPQDEQTKPVRATASAPGTVGGLLVRYRLELQQAADSRPAPTRMSGGIPLRQWSSHSDLIQATSQYICSTTGTRAGMIGRRRKFQRYQAPRPRGNNAHQTCGKAQAVGPEHGC